MQAFETQLRDAVKTALARPEIPTAVHQVYETIDKRLHEIKPACGMTGKCCHFEEYGHRLFVSTGELAAFVADIAHAPAAVAHAPDGTSCRFQVGNLCTAHSARPMGCRLFFCDPHSDRELSELYETMHQQLKRLHDQLEIPYFYVEWRQALVSIAPLIGGQTPPIPNPHLPNAPLPSPPSPTPLADSPTP